MATERQSDDSRVGTAGEEFRLNDAGFLQKVARKLLQELLETEMDDCLGAGR